MAYRDGQRSRGPLLTSAAETVHLLIPATYGDVRTVGEAIAALLQRGGYDDETTSQLVQLAVHEICTNIVDHAYAGQSGCTIDVTLTLELGPPRQFVVELRDSGQAFDPQSIGPVDLSEPREGGYGLFLARELMDAVHYQRLASQNLWRLTKTL